jgi:hypothetical protein
MKVEKAQNVGQGHSIELGESTWNPNERSIRDRWVTRTGGFNPRSSSEVPMDSLVPMIRVAAENDELSPEECEEIIAHLRASISRQNSR